MMSSLEDSYDYIEYSLEFYTEDDGPPLIKKTSRIILTVVQNDVEGLALLLDSPKWYNVTDNYGYDILQIAILRDNKEVFDYMMTLKDFPIDKLNKHGETALEISLTGFISNDIWMRDHYAYELLHRDVKIDVVCYEGNTLLHCALERCFVRVARLLIEKGADIHVQNEEGCTPLLICCQYCEDGDLVEGVTMLLTYGADLSICDHRANNIFDMIMSKTGDVLVAKEAVFNYTFDQYTRYNVDILILLKLADNKCPFFYKLLKSASKVLYTHLGFFSVGYFFAIEPKYLQSLVENCDEALGRFLLENVKQLDNFDVEFKSLDNLEILMNSKFRSLFTELIGIIYTTNFIDLLMLRHRSESFVTEVLCYFLSYGMTLNWESMDLIYERFSHSELFKLLLHMDIDKSDRKQDFIMAVLYYNVNIHLEEYLQQPDLFSEAAGVEELLSYSAHPKLKEICNQLDESTLIEKVTKLPQVPLLVELARNVFRKYFVEKLDITTSRRFYTLLKLLPVGVDHQRIIAFEQKLYY